MLFAAVLELELAREIGPPNAYRCRIEIEPEQIRRGLGCTDELIGAEEPVIGLAVEERSKPALDRHEAIWVGADRDPAGKNGKIGLCWHWWNRRRPASIPAAHFCINRGEYAP